MPLPAGVTAGTGSRKVYPGAFGFVSMETIQETGEMVIFADINRYIAQFVSNG